MFVFINMAELKFFCGCIRKVLLAISIQLTYDKISLILGNREVDTQTEQYLVYLLTSQYPHFYSVSNDQLHGNFSLMFVFC